MKQFILILALFMGLSTLNAQDLICTYELDVKSPELKVINYDKIKCKFKAADGVKISDKAYYHVLLFGKKAKTKMWVIADKSVGSEEYDLIYVDLNYNGIVGEEGEKHKLDFSSFFPKVDIKGWKNPSTGEVSDFLLSSKKSKYNKTRQSLHGVFKIQGYETMVYAEILDPNTPKTATKIWVGFEKPMTIRNYGKVDRKFYRGIGIMECAMFGKTWANERSWIIAYPGSTNLSCWYVDISYLAKGEHLVSEVEYTALDGTKKKHFGEIDERC